MDLPIVTGLFLDYHIIYSVTETGIRSVLSVDSFHADPNLEICPFIRCNVTH